jgi:alpha-mannosidase
MRDEGKHEFSYELACYNAPFANTDVIKDAENFARRFLSVKEGIANAELPFVISGNATVSHCKVAQDNKGVIVRIIEYSGKDGEAEIFLPSWVKNVYKTDMPEAKRDILSFNKTLKIDLRGFEILTLYCEK